MNNSSIINLLGDNIWLILINLMIFLLISIIIYRLIINIINFYQHKISYKNKKILEIIPLKNHHYSLDKIESAISLICNQLNIYEELSLEVNSSLENGISYRIVILEKYIKSTRNFLYSSLENIKIKENDLYIQDTNYKIYAFKKVKDLEEHMDILDVDPINPLLKSLSNLSKNQTNIFQLIIRKNSLKDSIIDYALKNRVQLIFFFIVFCVTSYLMNFILAINLLALLLVVYLIKYKKFRPKDKSLKQNYRLDVRLASAPINNSKINVKDLLVSLNGFSKIKNAFLITRIYPDKLNNLLNNYFFKNRSTFFHGLNSSISNAQEIALLFHFPINKSNISFINHTAEHNLPPLRPKLIADDFDLILGVNRFQGKSNPIGLTIEERMKHMFVVGGTGSGKTTLLKTQIIQDIKNNKGLAVIDPHGDLAEELLSIIPENRKKDLIYLNPDDYDQNYKINLMQIKEGLDDKEILKEKELITETLISILRKIFSKDDTGGHKIEYILRNTILTALTTKNPTIFTIYKLLNNNWYARSVVKDLKDENLKLFWNKELSLAGNMQRVKMTSGVTAKIGRFLLSESAKSMLGGSKSNIDFNEILDGKILICNLSKGRLGEDTSSFIGSIILAKIQLASLYRAKTSLKDRRPFYLYVDEFQEFANSSFLQMLSESRKYKLFLTMAEQSIRQQVDPSMIEIILANVGNIIAFRTSSPGDEKFLLQLFRSNLRMGDLSDLNDYKFYLKIASGRDKGIVSGETIDNILNYLSK